MASQAQIGTYTPQESAEGAMPRRTTPELSAVSTGRGVEEIGDALQQVARQDALVQVSKTMADTRAQWTQHLLDSQNSYQPGQEFTKTIGDSFSDYRAQTLKNASALARPILSQQLNSFGSELVQRSMEFEANARRDGRIDSWKQGANTAMNVARADPSQAEMAYGEQLATLNQLDIPPDKKIELTTWLRGGMAMESAKTKGEQDPYNTMVALTKADTGDSMLNRLTPEQRDQVQDHILSVQRMQNAADEHQLVMADKARKDASDTLSKQGDDLLRRGAMSSKWLESNRDSMEPNEYRYFTRALSGEGDAPTNPRIYADLLTKAGEGQDVRDQARQALYGGQIKKEDFAKIDGMVTSERPGWYKRGVSYLSGALDPGQLNPDPAAHLSRANAIDDWQSWATAHPQASDAEAKAEQQNLAQHYQIVNQSKSALLMRAPTYLVGTRLQPTDEAGKPDPMLKATAKRTLDALQRGDITQDEAQQQALLIAQYQKLATQQAAAAAASSKKP